METETIGPIQALSDGWLVFKRHGLLLFTGMAVLAALLVACFWIPYVNWLIILIAAFPLLGGLHTLFLNAARNSSPRLTDMFSGFRNFGKCSAGGWGFLFVIFKALGLTLALGYVYLITCLFMGPLASTFVWLTVFIVYRLAKRKPKGEEGIGVSRTFTRNLTTADFKNALANLLPWIVGPGPILAIGWFVHENNANAFGAPGWAALWVGVAIAAVFALSANAATLVRMEQLLPAEKPAAAPVVKSCPRKLFSVTTKEYSLMKSALAVLFIIMVLAVASPSFLSSRESSRARHCQQNLRAIETAKENWARDEHKRATDTPQVSDLVPRYLPAMPDCPSNGTYAIGNMVTDPTCSIGTNGDADTFNDHVR